MGLLDFLLSLPTRVRQVMYQNMYSNRLTFGEIEPWIVTRKGLATLCKNYLKVAPSHLASFPNCLVENVSLSRGKVSGSRAADAEYAFTNVELGYSLGNLTKTSKSRYFD